jgi:hypothetical protein
MFCAGLSIGLKWNGRSDNNFTVTEEANFSAVE